MLLCFRSLCSFSASCLINRACVGKVLPLLCVLTYLCKQVCVGTAFCVVMVLTFTGCAIWQWFSVVRKYCLIQSLVNYNYSFFFLSTTCWAGFLWDNVAFHRPFTDVSAVKILASGPEKALKMFQVCCSLPVPLFFWVISVRFWLSVWHFLPRMHRPVFLP